LVRFGETVVREPLPLASSLSRDRLPVKVAAYQAPMLPSGSMEAIGLVDPQGKVLHTAQRLAGDLLVADIGTAPRRR
jgi:hypothetical protein